jgi:hypothetical protein
MKVHEDSLERVMLPRRGSLWPPARIPNMHQARLLAMTIRLLHLCPLLHLCSLCLATLTIRLHRAFCYIDYIDGVPILLLYFSEINPMIGCLLIYQTYHKLCVNYNFLILVWIWLHACLSYDPRLVLIKLILYHINFVTGPHLDAMF